MPDPMEQEPWLIRLGIYRVFAISALLGLALTCLLAFLLPWAPTVWAALGIMFASGVAGAAAVLAWICLTPPPPLAPREFPIPVPLREFLRDSEAVIAPNLHPDTCDRLAQWLQDFSNRHGNDSVWILPLPDGPFADRVVLAVPALSSAEASALQAFDIEGIEELSIDTRSKHFPGLDPSRKLMEVVWD